MKNTFSFFFPLILFLTFILSSSSCVSKKKYLREVSLRTTCDTTLQQLNSRNLNLNRQLAEVKLALAEKTGERNAFRELLDKQEDQIDRLETEIESLTNQSLDQQSSMDNALVKKNEELKRQREVLQSFKDEIAKNEQDLKIILAKVGESLADYEGAGLDMEIKKSDGYIRLSEELIFRKGTTRLNSKSFEILEPIGTILMDYPLMEITVIGHTDNRPGKMDSWDLSTLRATALVRALTEDVGMAPNQIIAAGNGEFKPITSNETPEGREANRRTEIVIRPSVDLLLKKINEAK